jgi:hypothetical protein
MAPLLNFKFSPSLAFEVTLSFRGLTQSTKSTRAPQTYSTKFTPTKFTPTKFESGSSRRSTKLDVIGCLLQRVLPVYLADENGSRC